MRNVRERFSRNFQIVIFISILRKHVLILIIVIIKYQSYKRTIIIIVARYIYFFDIIYICITGIQRQYSIYEFYIIKLFTS